MNTPDRYLKYVLWNEADRYMSAIALICSRGAVSVMVNLRSKRIINWPNLCVKKPTWPGPGNRCQNPSRWRKGDFF